MRYFKDSEFNHLDKMDPQFLEFLDDVREEAGVPFILTSDGREAEYNRTIGGSERSLHVYDHGRMASAVDFTTPNGRARNKVGWREDLWKITRAVVLVAIQMEAATGRTVQLELVQGPTDWHVHLGLQPEGSTIKSKLILMID